MISVISVKDRLKLLAQKENRTMQNNLVLYALERTIYRISISKYKEYFTLKGGIFLYALFDRDYSRVTQDIDLLANNISNEANNIKEIFKNIFEIECDDALRFDTDTLNVKNITEFKEYHGLNVSIIAFLDKTRIPVSIDIGFGDIIYPNRVTMDFPVLLDMEAPNIYAYSIYSVIAEKFEAFVSLGLLNSRYKDFFDIYSISSKYDLDGQQLLEAVKETFDHRKSIFTDIVAFSDEYANDIELQSRWKSFIKKKQVATDIEFIKVINECKALLLPIVEHINLDASFNKTWNHLLKKWI